MGFGLGLGLGEGDDDEGLWGPKLDQPNQL